VLVWIVVEVCRVLPNGNVLPTHVGIVWTLE